MQLPVVKPLSFVTDAIEAMFAAGLHLTIPQRMNLALLVSSMILLRTLTLSQICLGWLYKRSVNAVSHFFNYAGLSGQNLMAYAVKFIVGTMKLNGVKGKLAILYNFGKASMNIPKRDYQKFLRYCRTHTLFRVLDSPYCKGGFISETPFQSNFVSHFTFPVTFTTL